MSDQAKKTNTEVSFALINKGIEHITKKVDNIDGQLGEMRNNFISRKEFEARVALMEEKLKPIRTIVYGTVGIIGMAILAAIIQSILQK